MAKWQRILLVAENCSRQIPTDRLEEQTAADGGRPVRQLGFHVFSIGEAFLEVTDGALYAAALFLKPVPAEIQTGGDIADYGSLVRARLENWWSTHDRTSLERTTATYYGMRTLGYLLERCTWHSAQHTRQLLALLDRWHTQPRISLESGDLEGLPLPVGVWE